MTRSTIVCLTDICLISLIFVLCFPIVSANENITGSPTPIIQNPQFDQEIYWDLMQSAITRQDQYLATNPLIKNDSVDHSENFTGFFCSNLTDSAMVSPDKNFSNINGSKEQEKFEVPIDGIIQHGTDGKTRVYSSDGKELYYIVDSKSENVRTPSGEVILASYSIGVPSSAVINLQNNKTYVLYKGKMLMTVIDEKPVITKNAIVNLPAQKDSPSWVEWAESNTAQYFGRFESHWIIPHSPNFDDQSRLPSNILFNGISSTDPRLQFIAQPVTAFNFRSNCKYQNNTGSPDPNCNYQNIWTGSAWFVYGNNAFHSYPPIPVYEGETVVGRTYTFTDIYGYDYFVNLFAQSDSSRNAAIYFFTNSFPSSPSYYQAVNTYEAWPAFDSSPGYCHTTPCFPDAWKISDATFSGNYAEQMNGNFIPLSWVPRINTAGHPEISGLSVDISQGPSAVKLITSDYRTKIGVYRNGEWHRDFNGDGAYPGVTSTFPLTPTGWTPVVGDWNGYNKTKIGVSNGATWYLDYNGNGIYDGPTIDRTASFGPAGYKPVVGDWNGDSKTKIGVEKDGFWSIDYNGNYVWDGAVTDRFASFGQTGDKPVVGDWNADGRTEIGSQKDGFWAIDYNGNYVWDGSVIDRFTGFGQTGDIPVVGDWNADGRIEIGSFKDGFWAIDYNGNYVWDGAVIDRFAGFGQTGDIPVVGDWNQNGKTKIGVYRNGLWLLDYNGNYVWDGAVIDKSYSFPGTSGWTPVVGKWN